MQRFRYLRPAFLAAAGMALATTLLGAGPASGATVSYVALGDSYSAGSGVPPSAPTGPRGAQ